MSVPGPELDGGNGLGDDSLAARRVLKGEARSLPRSKEFRPKIRLSKIASEVSDSEQQQ